MKREVSYLIIKDDFGREALQLWIPFNFYINSTNFTALRNDRVTVLWHQLRGLEDEFLKFIDYESARRTVKIPVYFTMCFTVHQERTAIRLEGRVKPFTEATFNRLLKEWTLNPSTPWSGAIEKDFNKTVPDYMLPGFSNRVSFMGTLDIDLDKIGFWEVIGTEVVEKSPESLERKRLFSSFGTPVDIYIVRLVRACLDYEEKSSL